MQHNTQQFKLLLTLKLQQLHSSGFKGISYEDLYKMFTTHVWKNRQPTHLSELADDVLNVHEDDVIRWLATQSRIDGYKSSLNDYAALIDKEEI